MKSTLAAVLICICIATVARAQLTDSTAAPRPPVLPTVVRRIDASSFSHDTLVSSTLDSVIQVIHLVNGAEKGFYAYLANNGSAADPTLFHPDLGVYTTAHLSSYDWLFRKDEDTKYYKTNKRFSEITYYSGAMKEQAVRVLHSQNITRNWSAGIDFFRGGAKGYLLNSETFKTSFDAYTWYHTRNHRYQVLAHASWETVKNQVNGGVSNDSLYDHLDLSSRDLQGLSVELSGAEDHVRNRIYSIRQFFDLGPKTVFDTGQTVFRHRPHYRISLANRVEKYSFAYMDGSNDTAYYANTYYHDINKDSLAAGDFRNELSLTRFASRSGSLPERLYYSAGLTWQWLEYRQRGIVTDYGNAGLKFTVRTTETDSALNAGVTGEYIFYGDNQSCYTVSGHVALPVSTLFTAGASADAGRSEPPVFFSQYRSNHFISTRTPSRLSWSRLAFRLAAPAWKAAAGVTAWSVGNYPYFDRDALPAQAPGTQTVLQLFLEKNFAWRKFRFDNTIWYQHAGSDSLLHLPEFSTYHALYYTVPAFRNSLYFATGIDARIQSHFEGNAFMPSTAFFYLQDSIRTGGQVIVNIFFDFRIKSADLFVKYENAGSLFFDNKYYLVPHYPMQGATFKVGLRWRFFDQ